MVAAQNSQTFVDGILKNMKRLSIVAIILMSLIFIWLDLGLVQMVSETPVVHKSQMCLTGKGLFSLAPIKRGQTVIYKKSDDTLDIRYIGLVTALPEETIGDATKQVTKGHYLVTLRSGYELNQGQGFEINEKSITARVLSCF